MIQRPLGLIVLAAAVAAGSWAKVAGPDVRPAADVLVADLHVHGFPGDGALTPRELAREAKRRGLDVIVLTGHNNQASWRLSHVWPFKPAADVIVVPGQEVTTPEFHLIAVGIRDRIDWRLSAHEAIAAIHRQGGAAIAAHPTEDSWIPRDPATLSALDGAEVAHPSRDESTSVAAELDAFFDQVRRQRPTIAPIGSSDFHTTAPLGRCRTYILVDERSEAGVIRAVREGRTVARDRNGRLIGTPEHVSRIASYLGTSGGAPSTSTAERISALLALAGLALLATGAKGQ